MGEGIAYTSLPGFMVGIHALESWRRKDGHGRDKPGHDGNRSARELLVLQPVRDDRIRAQATHLVGLVVLEVALEPFHVAVALEREDMRGDTVEKPAVVADNYGTAGKIFQ